VGKSETITIATETLNASNTLSTREQTVIVASRWCPYEARHKLRTQNCGMETSKIKDKRARSLEKTYVDRQIGRESIKGK
jgi:hypothetical protein